VSVAEAILEHLAAFNAHDTDRVLAGLAPDAVWITGRDVATGRAALAEVFDDWLWSLRPQLATVNLIADGDTAAAELREQLTVDGATREYAIAAFFNVRDGLITHAKIYREGNATLE
jgi:ketosteroid isomerase-like protein